jgi:hypothetical protein
MNKFNEETRGKQKSEMSAKTSYVDMCNKHLRRKDILDILADSRSAGLDISS